MSLERRGTLFGPPSIRGATPDSHENGSIKANSLLVASGNNSTRSKRRVWAAEDEEAPPKVRRQSEGKDPEEAGQSLNKFIPRAIQSKVSTGGNVRTQHSSPWGSLTKRFTLSLEDSVTIASRKDGLFVAVREFSGPDADRKLNVLRKIRNENLPNLLVFLECFSFGGSLFAVFEHEITRGEKLTVTLNHYALIKHYPTESQLAIILRQVLDGLIYLHSLGLEHGALTCKNILISTEGSIRITGLECCRELDSERGSFADIKGVGYVTMELMNKTARYDGPIEACDFRRWPRDTKVVKFLFVIHSACSIEKLEKVEKQASLAVTLLQHPLLSYETRESDMIGVRANVYMAEFSVFRGHNIPPQ